MTDEHQVAMRDVFLQAGYVCLPAEPTRLRAVVASGVAVTVFDRRLHHGGMGHYVRPHRRENASTTLYALPAIVSLVRMFENTGSEIHDLEAHLYGGAVNTEARGYIENLSEDNVRAGMDILKKLGVRVRGLDVGGAYGRKIVFHTGTGETIIAKVERIRATDWYV